MPYHRPIAGLLAADRHAGAKAEALFSPAGQTGRIGMGAQAGHGENAQKRTHGKNGKGILPTPGSRQGRYQMDRKQSQQKPGARLYGQHGSDKFRRGQFRDRG